MQYKLEILIAVCLAATQTAAYSHGEQGQFEGKAIKWQQLAEGVFTGVPAEQWDDKIHKPGFQELDFDEIMSWSGNNSTLKDRNLQLEDRNIPDTCKLAVGCAKKWSGVFLSEAYNAFFQAAGYVSGGKVMEFLNQPFVANAAGVAVAGVISGQINEATKKDCSNSGSELDVVTQAVKEALASNPESSSVSVSVTGPAGTWAVDITARPKGQDPPAKCADA
ncbi:hypothetical protein FBEOM_177 [Fusarium beomiforme]|uniref:Uncharacterized protein n=1 Tax=Fusarium beomiforme TaxID=44412 RepID=A0A9P5AWM4_9HYPO|nr:hypothetical protein FBEOM_177 [Fusarium beomiforme]